MIEIYGAPERMIVCTLTTTTRDTAHKNDTESSYVLHARRFISLYALWKWQVLVNLGVDHLLQLPFWIKLALGERLGE